MYRRTLQTVLCLLCCLGAGVVFQPASVVRGEAARPAAIMEITGTVLGVGGHFGGRTHPFRLIINRYTEMEDAERLNNALQSGGQDELLSTLRKMNAGRIIIGESILCLQ